jgi:hypothetical protein
MAKVPNAIAATGSYYRGKTHTNRHKVSFTPRTICAGVEGADSYSSVGR